MNRRHGGASGAVREHFQTIALLAFLLATFGTAAYPSLVEAVTFTDDFNRPDSATVGNGWSDTTGNLGNLAIRTNELTCPSASGGTFRPFPFTAPITTTARVKEQSGFGTLLRRYVTRFLVRNNGTFNQGYGVVVTRSDQNFSNSTVILVEDNVQLASIPSTFQYGPEINVSVTFNLDGSITGTVSEPAPSTNTFSFSFGPHAIQSTGDNFSIAVECSSGPVDQRIDDVVTSSEVIPSTGMVYLLLHGTASGPETWNKLVSKTFGGTCPETALGQPITQDSLCYRHRFRTTMDEDGNEWLNGDGVTFDELGAEVKVTVDKIDDKLHPSAIVLVGHSRGGVAARAYLQELTAQPLFNLGLLTIGSPHQGTPLGRAVQWLEDEGKTVDDLFITSYTLRSLLFSPSVRYQATDHDVSGNPIRTSISEAIWQLNDAASRVDDWVSSFGQVYSVQLHLGENARGGSDVLDNNGILSRLLIPGDFKELRAFILQNTGDIDQSLKWTKCTKEQTKDVADWACNGDGIAPTISQQLVLLPGFSPGTKPLHEAKLVKTSHTNETAQVNDITSLLNQISNDIE